MKNFLSLAKSRKTTYEFSSRAVPASKLSSILEAARWAPTPLNSQPYSFLVVKNKKDIESIVGAAYYGIFHTLPPTIILIALSPGKTSSASHRGMQKGRLGEAESYMSVSMPALLMALAAEDNGLGSCMLSLDEKKLPSSLGLVEGQKAPLAIGIGYPETKQLSEGISHSRLPLSKLVKYGRM